MLEDAERDDRVDGLTLSEGDFDTVLVGVEERHSVDVALAQRVRDVVAVVDLEGSADAEGENAGEFVGDVDGDRDGDVLVLTETLFGAVRVGVDSAEPLREPEGDFEGEPVPEPLREPEGESEGEKLAEELPEDELAAESVSNVRLGRADHDSEDEPDTLDELDGDAAEDSDARPL